MMLAANVAPNVRLRKRTIGKSAMRGDSRRPFGRRKRKMTVQRTSDRNQIAVHAAATTQSQDIGI